MSDEIASPKRAVRSWPYRSTPPQRYAIDTGTYERIGGSLDLGEFIKGYMPDGVTDGDLTRFYAFALLFEQLAKENIPGDLLELGTYQGRTAALLAAMARRLGRTLYVLDTFEGFDSRDITGPDQGARVGTFNDTSLEAVRARVGEENVRFVKGYFPETASQLPDDATYALVHIDCDLYAPILSALEYFYPRMQPGGFILVHDYSSPNWIGAERAVDDFFADKPEAIIPMPDGAGTAMVRRSRMARGGDNWLQRRRFELLNGGWRLVGNSQASDVLGHGWRGPEKWGVWGIGDRHELCLSLDSIAGTRFELQADVNAFLAGPQTEQTIDVRVDGQPAGSWQFTAEANRGVRTVPITVPPGQDRYRTVSVTFHPRALGIPAELSPKAAERHPLGLGLYRLRLAVPGQG